MIAACLPLLFVQTPQAAPVPRVVPARIAETHRRISSWIRLAGTPGDRAAADYVAEVFRKAGLAVEIHEYDVLLSRAEMPSLAVVPPGGRPKRLELAEKGFPWDRDSFDGIRVPPQIAYTPSAEVTAEVVYANYGLAADYEALAKLGIDVRGKIVLARYGRAFRGVKLLEAERRGAAALLLYSDPADDGFARGDPYPRGTMRPADGVQRGSPLYLFRYPGDPLTPGRPALPDAPRLKAAEARSLPRIPALAIGAAAAQPILAGLSGPVAPNGFQGALPLTYHTGPGPGRVHLEIRTRLVKERIRDVIGVLEGKSGPRGDFVMLGNHRDSWVHGAVDAATGTACMLEAARVLGARARAGWRPDRTIRFASFDGEEFGVIGSTEYGEERADFLAEHLVAYVNADSVVSGPNFGAAATPSLAAFAAEAARGVLHPDLAKPLAETMRGKPGLLGGGSDFMVFLDRLGIPCIEWSMSGPGGVYHSAYDTHWFVRERADPGFHYHAALAKVLVRALTALADARARVFDPFAALALVRRRIEKQKAELPARACAEVLALAEGLEQRKSELAALPARELARLDRVWLDAEGLPGRPWFKNLLVAPGLKTGYAAVLLPELEEALARGDRPGAERALQRLRARLEAFAAALDALARGGGRGRR